MKALAKVDWTPGGTEEMPYALNVSREIEVDVQAGFWLSNSTVVLRVAVDDGQFDLDNMALVSRFGRYPYPLSAWVNDAMRLSAGETAKIRNRTVTRMTEHEINRFFPLDITSRNYH